MRLLLTAAAFCVAFASAASAQDVVRLATEGAYPPYNFIDDNNEVAGFERELGDRMCEIAELNCVWVTNEWDSIIPNLVSGNYDAIMAGMSITAERDEVIDFTQAYFPPDPSAYVALAGADESAQSGVVAAQVNTIQSSHVASTGATLLEFATPEETIAAVRNGEADSVLADRAFLAPLVEESNGELVFLSEVMLGGGIGVGVRESDGDLRAAFEAAITTLRESGELNEIIGRWFEGHQGFQ